MPFDEYDPVIRPNPSIGGPHADSWVSPWTVAVVGLVGLALQILPFLI